MDSPRWQTITDVIIGIPLLLIFACVLLLIIPPFYCYQAIARTTCPRCWIPLARRIRSTTFERENIKFNVDHYKVACSCRWCGGQWDYEITKPA